MEQSWSLFLYKTEEELLAEKRRAWQPSWGFRPDSAYPGWNQNGLTRDRNRHTLPGDGLNEDFPADGRSILTLSSREVYRNHWMRLREDEILRSNGQKGLYGVVEKDDAAIILPIDGETIWLVEQYRYTIEERALELPQGGWEMAIDNPEDLARGELREEVGLAAKNMFYLGSLWIAYGFTRQRQHVYLATGLSQVPRDPDAEEHDLVVHRLPITEFEEKMRNGRIRDNCTLSAWGLYLLWKSKRG